MLSRIRRFMPLLLVGACLAWPGVANATIPVNTGQFFQVSVSGTLSTVDNNGGLFDASVSPGASFTANFVWSTSLTPATSGSSPVTSSTWSASGNGAALNGTIGDISFNGGSASTETVINTDSSLVNSQQAQTNGAAFTGLSGAYNQGSDFVQIYLNSTTNAPSLTDPSIDWSDAWTNKAVLIKITPASGLVSSFAIGTINTVNVTTVPNVSGQITVSVVSSTVNPITHVYTYRMSASNTGGSTVSGPVQVLVGNIPVGVTLSNASGTAATGQPFVTVSAASIAAGASVPFTLTFADPSKVPTNVFTTQVYSGSL